MNKSLRINVQAGINPSVDLEKPPDAQGDSFSEFRDALFISPVPTEIVRNDATGQRFRYIIQIEPCKQMRLMALFALSNKETDCLPNAVLAGI